MRDGFGSHARQCRTLLSRVECAGVHQRQTGMKKPALGGLGGMFQNSISGAWRWVVLDHVSRTIKFRVGFKIKVLIFFAYVDQASMIINHHFAL